MKSQAGRLGGVKGTEKDIPLLMPFDALDQRAF